MKLTIEIEMRGIDNMADIQTRRLEHIRVSSMKASLTPDVLEFREDSDPTLAEEIKEAVEFHVHAQNLMESIVRLAQEHLSEAGFKTQRYLKECSRRNARTINQHLQKSASSPSGHPIPASRNEMDSKEP